MATSAITAVAIAEWLLPEPQCFVLFFESTYLCAVAQRNAQTCVYSIERKTSLVLNWPIWKQGAYAQKPDSPRVCRLQII